MSTKFTEWDEIKAAARQADPRTETQRAEARDHANERHEAYLRGHQLAEMRKTIGLPNRTRRDTSVLVLKSSPYI